jgi:hypothetical protein
MKCLCGNELLTGDMDEMCTRFKNIYLTEKILLDQVEALKVENRILHNILGRINEIVWNNFMIKDKHPDINFVRKEMIKLLEEWASI